MKGIPEYKIVTLGEGRVGKTSLSLKYVNDTFHENEKSTVQANFLEKVTRVDDQQVKLNLWDTAGQERFRAMQSIYYREARGAVLVYDITDGSSFERVTHWVKELNEQVGKINIIIAGNKWDREQFRQVDKQRPPDFAASVGAQHFLTSAKTGKNVDDMYNALVRDIRQADSNGNLPNLTPRRGSNRGVKIEMPEPEANTKKKKSCC